LRVGVAEALEQQRQLDKENRRKKEEDEKMEEQNEPQDIMLPVTSNPVFGESFILCYSIRKINWVNLYNLEFTRTLQCGRGENTRSS